MQNKLKTRIMRRVYGIWLVRTALPMLAGSALFITAALRLAAERFFVAAIEQNLLFVINNNFMGLPRYIASALNHAEPSLLILISGAGIAGFALAVKLLRSIRSIVASGSLGLSYQSRR